MLLKKLLKKKDGTVTNNKKCPYCNNKIIGHPNKKFCNQSHKDKYHNTVNPRGYYKHLKENDYDEDNSWDAHKSY